LTGRSASGRPRVLKVERLPRATSAAEVWRWVARLIEGTPPETLDQLHDVRVTQESVAPSDAVTR
jgi:hypothetical protein